MSNKHELSVYPLVDKFYVYALFKKGDYNPFYIGKGCGTRINSHFKPSACKRNSPKNQTIKKYKNTIRREILCYFDDELSAYSFEEYLIDYYGLKEEGGCLLNYAKTRFQYSKKFAQEISSLGCKHRKREYSPEKVKNVLDLYYKDKMTYQEISSITDVNANYIGYVVRGVKCKEDYTNYINSLGVSEEYLSQQRKEIKRLHKMLKKSKSPLSDTEILTAFNMVVTNKESLEDVAKDLGACSEYLDDVFKGRCRTNLKLDVSLYLSVRKTNTEKRVDQNKRIVSQLLHEGLSVKDICIKTGFSKTNVWRYIHRLKSDGMATPFEGTRTTGSDSNAADANLENAG